jgi:hypothetical protein
VADEWFFLCLCWVPAYFMQERQKKGGVFSCYLLPVTCSLVAPRAMEKNKIPCLQQASPSSPFAKRGMKKGNFALKGVSRHPRLFLPSYFV